MKFLQRIKSANEDTILKGMTYFMLVFFVILILGSFFSINERLATEERNYQQLIESTNAFNEQVKKNSQKEDDKEQVTEVLFNNGKDAVLKSYEKFLSCKTMKVVMSGKLAVSAVGGAYKLGVDIYATSEKYVDKTTQMVITYEKPGSTRNGASYNTLVGDVVYSKSSKIVSKSGSNYVANFNNSQEKEYTLSQFKKEKGIVPGKIFYVINASTIKSVTSYKILRNSQNGITGYEVKIILDNSKSTVDYKVNLKGNMKPVGDITFTSIEATVNIDSNGNLRYISVDENYHFQSTVFGSISTRTDVDSVLNINILEQNY